MLKKLITATVKNTVKNSKTETKYREPLVGFADAQGKRFKKLKEIITPEYKLPTDILSEGRSVIAFFIPFAKEVVKANAKGQACAPKWAIAYKETNQLISKICRRLKEQLAKENIKAAWEEPTHNFDEERLISFWSHRSTAKICGLGEFGLNNMLITKRGSAGRYGSIVIDRQLKPSEEFEGTPCLYYRQGTCGVCIEMCPTGALTKEEFKREACYKLLLKNNERFKKRYDGVFDVCGKCQVGPCAFQIPE